MADEHARVNPLAVGAGLTVGVLWLAMATWCLVTSIQGGLNHRPDWALAWALVGVLLGAAGGAAIVGTLWHQYRVKRHHA